MNWICLLFINVYYALYCIDYSSYNIRILTDTKQNEQTYKQNTLTYKDNTFVIQKYLDYNTIYYPLEMIDNNYKYVNGLVNVHKSEKYKRNVEHKRNGNNGKNGKNEEHKKNGKNGKNEENEKNKKENEKNGKNEENKKENEKNGKYKFMQYETILSTSDINSMYINTLCKIRNSEDIIVAVRDYYNTNQIQDIIKAFSVVHDSTIHIMPASLAYVINECLSLRNDYYNLVISMLGRKTVCKLYEIRQNDKSINTIYTEVLDKFGDSYIEDIIMKNIRSTLDKHISKYDRKIVYAPVEGGSEVDIDIDSKEEGDIDIKKDGDIDSGMDSKEDGGMDSKEKGDKVDNTKVDSNSDTDNIDHYKVHNNYTGVDEDTYILDIVDICSSIRENIQYEDITVYKHLESFARKGNSKIVFENVSYDLNTIRNEIKELVESSKVQEWCSKVKEGVLNRIKEVSGTDNTTDGINSDVGNGTSNTLDTSIIDSTGNTTTVNTGTNNGSNTTTVNTDHNTDSTTPDNTTTVNTGTNNGNNTTTNTPTTNTPNTNVQYNTNILSNFSLELLKRIFKFDNLINVQSHFVVNGLEKYLRSRIHLNDDMVRKHNVLSTNGYTKLMEEIEIKKEFVNKMNTIIETGGLSKYLSNLERSVYEGILDVLKKYKISDDGSTGVYGCMGLSIGKSNNDTLHKVSLQDCKYVVTTMKYLEGQNTQILKHKKERETKLQALKDTLNRICKMEDTNKEIWNIGLNTKCAETRKWLDENEHNMKVLGNTFETKAYTLEGYVNAFEKRLREQKQTKNETGSVKDDVNDEVKELNDEEKVLNDEEKVLNDDMKDEEKENEGVKDEEKDNEGVKDEEKQQQTNDEEKQQQTNDEEKQQQKNDEEEQADNDMSGSKFDKLLDSYGAFKDIDSNKLNELKEEFERLMKEEKEL